MKPLFLAEYARAWFLLASLAFGYPTQGLIKT